MKRVMIKILTVVLCLLVCVPFVATLAGAAGSELYVNIADYVTADTGEDVSAQIQAVVDANPNRTIFFPDGEYVLAKPILTPANPRKSVSLELSDFAVLKAAEGWEKGQAVVQLGGKDAFNDTHTPGSNYSMDGGVIDCSGIANGISINSGRETAVRNVSIKNAVVGLHIMYGANSGSSDADITGLNIIGNGTTESIGILLEGFDNTITNVRIGHIYTGVHIKSGGNMLRNIHPLYYSDYTDYANSCGFLIECGDNWLDYCYADNFGIGYRTTGNFTCTFVNAFSYWYPDRGGVQVLFKADDKFNSNINGIRAGFNGNAEKCILQVGNIGGTGTIQNLEADTQSCPDKSYMAYVNDQTVFTRIIGFCAMLFDFLSDFLFNC